MSDLEKMLKDAAVQILAAARTQARREIQEELAEHFRHMGGQALVTATEDVHKDGAHRLRAFAQSAKPRRKKGPIQLCPAPGCKERAAPVFGMVCKKHKGAPKATVAKWREARRKKAKK
jgi:transposase